MFNIDAKSLLAKLLAEESLNVEFQKISTASFDLKNRTIYLPILKTGLSENIIDLFISHEVGHALFSPVKDTLESFKTYSKSIINILEDVRIERKIQIRYLGLKPIYIKAYKELHKDRNFFNIDEEDINTYNFLNRLNLYAKVGPDLLIEFNEEEWSFVNRAFQTETFDDVLLLAKDLTQYLKDKQENEETELNEFVMSEDGIGEFGDESEFSEFEEESDVFDSGFTDEFDVSTYDSFEKNFDNLIDDECKEQLYINIPTVDSKHFIVNYKKIFSDMEIEYEKNKWRYGKVKMKSNPKFYNDFLTENSKTIQFLINEFNIRRNAKQLRKTKISKRGNLDIKKLQNYKISENLFKSIQITENEKSHGLVLFLDWSGSMDKILNDTVKQLLSLLVFCKKLSIPFDVYAFSSRYTSIQPYCSPRTHNTLMVNNFKCQLLNLFTSSMSDKDFKKMANMLLAVTPTGTYFDADLFDIEGKTIYHVIEIPSIFQLSRTPIEESIVLAMDVVPKFKQNYKLDKVNTIFLTDGEASPNIDIISNDALINFNTVDYSGYFFKNKIIYLRDTESKITVKATNSIVPYKKHYCFDVTATKALFDVLRQKLDDNLICYRIIDPKDIINGRVDYYFSDNILSSEKRATLRSQLNSKQYLSISNNMHDKSFLVKNSSLKMGDEEYEIDKSASVKKMASIFSKSITKKMTNRIFLQDFIGMIS